MLAIGLSVSVNEVRLCPMNSLGFEFPNVVFPDATQNVRPQVLRSNPWYLSIIFTSPLWWQVISRCFETGAPPLLCMGLWSHKSCIQQETDPLDNWTRIIKYPPSSVFQCNTNWPERRGAVQTRWTSIYWCSHSLVKKKKKKLISYNYCTYFRQQSFFFYLIVIKKVRILKFENSNKWWLLSNVLIVVVADSKTTNRYGSQPRGLFRKHRRRRHVDDMMNFLRACFFYYFIF